MKKTILASAIAGLITAQANAATVYEANGLSYNLNGDWQIQLRQEAGDNKDPHVEFDDLEIKNAITYDLSNGLSAVGQLDFGFKKAAEDKDERSHLEEAYVGLKYGPATLTLGKMDLASDDFGVEMAYELISDEDRFDAQGTNGDDVISLDVELDNLSLALSAELEATDETSANGRYYDLLVSSELAGVKLAAAYQYKEATPTSASEDTWGVSASYDLSKITLAADISTTDKNSHDIDQYNLAARIKATNSTSVALGVVNTDDESVSDDVTEWYANVTYTFPSQQNVSVFAEIADTDESGADPGYLGGMRLKF